MSNFSKPVVWTRSVSFKPPTNSSIVKWSLRLQEFTATTSLLLGMAIVRKRGWLSVGILFDHPTEALLKSIRKSHPIFSTNRDAVWPSIKIINSTPAGTEDQIKRVLASIIRPSRPFPLYFLRKRFENHKEKLEDQELRPRTPQKRRNRQVRLYFESPQLE
jgi:hypothetical protein